MSIIPNQGSTLELQAGSYQSVEYVTTNMVRTQEAIPEEAC